ncbi:HesA/MoeB/ThiF family protein [Gallaecimonas sp. GXIMD4217]|uniref:HesA/MoeB/ThiF family protein n=1 Tax=Gallaecimonas sp. GXIMD4217 TaxID=3131927 RepID=UPI00311AC292
MRYQRQTLLWGQHGQQQLASKRVAIVGLGGLGCPAALYLAGAGVGRLRLIDDDKVEIHNLHRQVLYRSQHLGTAKAESARRQLQALNPHCEVEDVPERLSQRNIGRLLADCDLVLDCADGLASKLLLNRHCRPRRLPLISATANRWQWRLQLVHRGPCLACLFGEVEHSGEGCDALGVAGPILGMAGSQQALLALRLLQGLPVRDDLLQLYDGERQQWHELALVPEPDCPVCA